jgi:hypothetical protein
MPRRVMAEVTGTFESVCQEMCLNKAVVALRTF